MDTAKLFENGKSQAVRLPKKFRFIGDEVFVQRLGDVVMLTPKNAVWETFLNGLDGFTEDCFASGRETEYPTKRDML